MHLKINNNERFLNPAKGVEFKYKETDAFLAPVAEPDEPLYIDSKISSCKVIGVFQSSNQLSCSSCFKKVFIQPNSTLASSTVPIIVFDDSDQKQVLHSVVSSFNGAIF